MATLYVTEFDSVASVNTLRGSRGVEGQAPLAPAIAEQTVAIAGSTTQSSAFNKNTTLIRVHTDSICSVDIGANPTATTSKMRMAAGQTEFFGVTPGHKIAVISNV